MNPINIEPLRKWDYKTFRNMYDCNNRGSSTEFRVLDYAVYSIEHSWVGEAWEVDDSSW